MSTTLFFDWPLLPRIIPPELLLLLLLVVVLVLLVVLMRGGVLLPLPLAPWMRSSPSSVLWGSKLRVSNLDSKLLPRRLPVAGLLLIASSKERAVVAMCYVCLSGRSERGERRRESKGARLRDKTLACRGPRAIGGVATPCLELG